jgi:hypothetical protein
MSSPSIDFRENREFAAELKFLVPRSIAHEIREWARANLQPDPNAGREGPVLDGYVITSLYFDTDQFDVFHRNGSYGRSKYRIRRYGDSDVAFLERKLKTRGLVSKRRSTANLAEIARLEGTVPLRDWTGYWYHQRLIARRLKPICQIAYSRTARVGMTGFGPIRLTLDEKIQSVVACGLNFRDEVGSNLISEDDVIVELKYRSDLPVLFQQLIDKFGLTPQPVSKYRLAVVALGFVTPVEKQIPADTGQLAASQLYSVFSPDHPNKPLNGNEAPPALNPERQNLGSRRAG